MRTVLLVAGCLALAVCNRAGGSDSTYSNQALARRILADPELKLVLTKGRALLKTGLNAGTGYGEVWIRDLNTFIELALEENDPKDIREGLLNFFKFQGPDGDIVDGYIPMSKATIGYKYRSTLLAPGLSAHKNTVETDQESSLVQAIRKYVAVTRDRSILTEQIDGVSVRDRLGRALEYLLKHRFDEKRGLIWGATTADWGDVQPEHDWGVELDGSSHRAIDVYDNAMLIVAIEDYLTLTGDSPKAVEWKRIRDDLKRNTRKHLWDERNRKFIPHVYLGDSPFPKELKEDAIYYHGGTAVAIEAGLLTREEIAHSLAAMVENVRQAGASSIGLTVYPPYPQGSFKNRSMEPYGYQNGGDWCWFGGRMIQQLIRHGFVEEAYRELKPMVARVNQHGDFYEWWSRDNQPRGSKQFRGSAGVLGKAIQMLQRWAEQNQGAEKP